jgi:FKBP-type peptidyl-prolyl cis-trans isomerase 2
VHEGDGGACPRDGDEVLLHLCLRTADAEERLLTSTRADEGGRGVPLRAVLGAECTLLRGVEIALAAFTAGERAVLRLPLEFAYGAPGRARAAGGAQRR